MLVTVEVIFDKIQNKELGGEKYFLQGEQWLRAGGYANPNYRLKFTGGLLLFTSPAPIFKTQTLSFHPHPYKYVFSSLCPSPGMCPNYLLSTTELSSYEFWG